MISKRIYLDTSALIAYFDADEYYHVKAVETHRQLLVDLATIYVSNYVILETCVLLRNRYGMAILQKFIDHNYPLYEKLWITEAVHEQALNLLLTANRRQLSLVDCTSFVLMRSKGIQTVFTFDKHFAEQGFHVIP